MQTHPVTDYQPAGDDDDSATSGTTASGGSGSSQSDYDDYDDGDVTSDPIVTSTQFIYTAQSDFGEAAMQHFVRAPALELLISDADVAADVEVRCLFEVAIAGLVRICPERRGNSNSNLNLVFFN